MIKVACYCRVSTTSADQIHSLESQESYFRSYLNGMPDWELYEIYADEGITGTSTRKRQAFRAMMHDAWQGKFQRIITKEVSRFSRNILDTIAYTRELKGIGIGVVFLTDGFCSLDPDAELRLSIMGSLAQEESRRTSTRVKWGQTRQMERGVVFGTSMLGYDVSNGQLHIEPVGAEIVRRIYHKYSMEGKGAAQIARELESEGILTYEGNHRWQPSTVLRILKNEKYVGDLVQKKTITPDYLTHDKKYNHGQEPLVVIREHHEPIISRELWELTQREIARRTRKKESTQTGSGRHMLSGKIQCGCCGSGFISRTKKLKDGSVIRRWGCARAAKEGRRKVSQQGIIHGCDIGILLRDDLARKMITLAITENMQGREWLESEMGKLLLCEIPEFREIRTELIASMVCEDVFLRAMVDRIILSPGGLLEIRLRNCPKICKFLLV